MARKLRVLRLSFAYAVIAALLSFYPLCLETYQLVLGEDAPLSTEGETGHILPIPKSLLWSPATKNLVSSLTLLPPGAVICLAIVLFSILVFGLLRTLNPTFRLTTGMELDRTVLTKTYMHTAPLIKAFLIFMAALVPLFIVWAALHYLTGSSFPALAARLSLFGATAWLLFSRDGLAGDYDSLNYELPRDSQTVRSLLLRGACAGLGLAVTVWFWRYTESRALFDFFYSLGSIGEGHWRTIVLIVCGTAAILGFATAAILVSLGLPSASPSARIVLALGGFATLALIYFGRAVALPSYLASRYEYDPMRDSVDSEGITRGAKRLAKLAGVPMRTEEMDTILVFRRNRLAAWNIPRRSITGIDAGPESADRIERFLRDRKYVTSLADAAYKTLHDAASLQWDSEALLRVQFQNLERSPDISYARLLVAKLRSAASTPVSLKYADKLADESRFAYVTRDAKMAVGDIYARLGERSKAESWYLKAGVPAARLPELLSARTMFADGKLTGRLLLNGKPLSGARVGLVPFVTLREATVSTNTTGVVRPYWLRWIGPTATTDSAGRFEVTRIVAGEYRLLLTHPDIRLRPMDPSVSGTQIPGRLFVGFGRPKTDLGDIAITINPPTATSAPNP